MALRWAPHLVATAIPLLYLYYISSHTLHAAAPASGDKASFLYAAEDAAPVLDHGLPGIDFARSRSPKVVEFYDPKCGACQAFRSNYVEVAKRVRARRPGVEFYGVSCEVHPGVCDRYGGRRVPRIFAFPGSSADPADGIEVPKGAGTIYFLSERLAKALRTPEEVASDAEKLGVGVGGGGNPQVAFGGGSVRR